MAQLSSPGVAVTVIDESFYTPSAPGTTPLLVIASAENKANGANTGTAPGTLAANAGKVYLMTSQKDLSDTFGTPVFKTDANNNPIHAGEQNEYGLQAAYSYLGVSNRAYVVRADIDLAQLDATSEAPAGDPEDGQYWLDTANTNFGIFQWNSAAATTLGGQTFSNTVPLVITESNKIDVGTDGPKSSIGAVGEYALVVGNQEYVLWYKKSLTSTPAGTWVKVGSAEWTASWPAAQGTTANPTFLAGDTFIINGNTFTGHTGLTTLVADINTALDDSDGAGTGDLDNPVVPAGISAAIVNNRLELYSTGVAITISGQAVAKAGLESKVYNAPALQISPHFQVPTYKLADNPNTARGFPTGSLWIKTTEPNLGARWRVKIYNADTKAWVERVAPIFSDNASALKTLDNTGGGINLAQGALYIKHNITSGSPATADFKIYARRLAGATEIISGIAPNFGSLQNEFTIQETVKGKTTMSNPVTVSFDGSDGVDGLLVAISAALSTATWGSGDSLVPITSNVTASVTSTGRVVIRHADGGDIAFVDGAESPLAEMFTPYGFNQEGNLVGTINFYTSLDSDFDYVASLWSPNADITTSASAPTTIASAGQLWYNSMVDEVDLMIHNGETWVGYQYDGSSGLSNFASPVYSSLEDAKTDPAGPIVSATKPRLQSDGSDLVNGDLWIDTSDLENYPALYKYNLNLQQWVIVDTTDQTTEDGIVFADARWTTGPGTGDEGADPATIVDLLASDFLDFDAPDPALYPKGMLLWNLRRSGFNVKKFVRDYVDLTADNERQEGAGMASYYPHRWVTESGNQENGAGTFGRKAQRKVVIQALQSLVNVNQQIRDEESRVFNLLACPGYPELIGELVNLNYDRGLTSFVVGDTPARLTADATSLNNWGTNQAGAVEDNDTGLVSSDEYLGIFYPWGFTSDNLGNNIVVPPSHMILRTIALNDQVSYPWFAPAGTRRGGITNATAVGYVDAEGEFQSVALNNGQRDTLAGIKVNPITFITGTGLVNYGQYTRARNASALDRINVARLVIYLRRQFAQLAKPYVFEPNDKITRDEIKGAAESLLLELVGQRALYDYIVVCDTSNNTPARIDRSELYLDVAIEPVKAVEFIYIPLRLKNTGEIAGLA